MLEGGEGLHLSQHLSDIYGVYVTSLVSCQFYEWQLSNEMQLSHENGIFGIHTAKSCKLFVLVGSALEWMKIHICSCLCVFLIGINYCVYLFLTPNHIFVDNPTGVTLRPAFLKELFYINALLNTYG